MTHLAAALFFVIALLSAAVVLHMTVRQYWAEIVLALRGELGLELRPVERLDRARPVPARIPRAAS